MKKKLKIDNIIELAKIERMNRGHFFVEHSEEMYSYLPHSRNSFNLVGEEIDPEAEILALGCSVTSALGIPHQLTWPHLVAKHTGKSVNVLAAPGLGIQEILLVMVGYLVSPQMSLPKKIFILSPDIFRTNISDVHTLHQNVLGYDSKIGFLIGNKKIPRLNDTYLKKFTPSVEYTVLAYLRQIEMCFNICKAFGVEVKVSSWDIYTQRIFNELDYIDRADMTDCFSDEEGYWSFENECTKHVLSVPDDLKHFWDLAIDTEGHPGLHHHIHYAESVLGHDLDLKMLEDLHYDNRWLEFVKNK